MRKFFLGLLLLILVLIGVAVALPFVLPRDVIRAEVERRLTAELGREVAIEGPLEFRPWRPFALSLSDVRVANPEWASNPELARIARVDLDVDALAYLGGSVVIERLMIDQPLLALEIREDGTASWDMGPPAEDAPTTDDDRPRDGQRPAEPAERRPLPEIRINDARLTAGSVAFVDRAQGETRNFSDIELWARSEPGSPALHLDGSVTSANERATLNAVVGDLNRLLAGEPSTLTLDLAAPGLGLAADGEATPAGTTVLAVHAEMAPRVLLDWLGQPLDMPAGALETVLLTTDMAAAPAGIALQALTLEVDDLTIGGDLEVALADRPRISGSLDLGDLDLRPYLVSDPAAPAVASDAAGAAPNDNPDGAGWPDEPLELPLPLPFDLAVNVRMSSLTTPDIALGIGAASLDATAEETTLLIDELSLYEGGMTGRLALRPGQTLGLEAEIDMIGVQIRPLLAAVADVEHLAGIGNFRFGGTTRGASVAELVGGLDGEGAVLIRDGAILGLNIAATVRQVASLGAVSAAGEPQRTDFAEAGGTFTVDGGVLANDDFALRAPILRVLGAGSVDLGARTLDYRLMPRLATTLEGQDAQTEGAFQAGLPLVVQGSWDDPAIRLDLGTALSGDVSEPAALADVVRNLAADPERRRALQDALGLDPQSPLGGVLEGLGGLLGGARPPAPDDETAPDAAPRDPAEQVLDSLRGLLRR